MMSRTFVSRRVLALAALALPIVAAGCSGGMTYGTGTSTSAQTFADLTSLARFGVSPDEAPIAYAPRAGLVIPPDMSTLPPPGDPNAPNPNLPTNQVAVDGSGPLGFGRIRGQAPPTGGVASSDIFVTPGGSVDAAGNPIRVALIEPPVEYRVPDATAAVTSANAAEPATGGSSWSRFWRSLWPF